MTSTEAELGLDDDLNLGPNVSLLDFGKLVEGIAAGSLAVEYLVKLLRIAMAKVLPCWAAVKPVN